MKKKGLNLLLLLFFAILCISQEGMSQAMYVKNMGLPLWGSMDNGIYMCAEYTISYSYRKKSYSKRYKYEEREVCSCFDSDLSFLERKVRAYSQTVSILGYNAIIIWDTNFIINHILPLFTKIEDRKKIIYTLNQSNDSTFKDIIDYDNKVIINDKIYYYPMKVKKYILFPNVNYEWLKEIVPQSSWIYNPNCYDEGKGMRVNLLIPLLN